MINIYKEIINNGFNSIMQYYKALIGALTIPAIFLILLNYWSMSGVEGLEKGIFIILTVLIDIVIAITVHRIIILGKWSVPRLGFFWVGSRGVRFFFASVGIGLISVVPIISAVYIVNHSILLAVVIILATVVMVSRLFLVFPAIAADEQMNFSLSWEYTKDHKLLLFIVAVFVPFVIVTFITFIYTFFIQFLMNIISPELSVLFVFLNLISSVIFISMLSASYKYLTSIELPQKEKKFWEED